MQIDCRTIRVAALLTSQTLVVKSEEHVITLLQSLVKTTLCRAPASRSPILGILSPTDRLRSLSESQTIGPTSCVASDTYGMVKERLEEEQTKVKSKAI